MNIYNFTNKGQGEFYDATRPCYTKEMFEYAFKLHKGKKENYLDIACGSGQLTFPFSEHFSGLKIGVDISDEPLKKAQLKQKEKNSDIIFVESDVFKMENYLDTRLFGTSKIFDLITIGQALHWFNEDSIFPFLHQIIKDDGTIAIFGYKKQHFLITDPLYEPFENYFKLIKPYFECDSDNNDNHYYKTNFTKYFKTEEPAFFTEETTISLSKLINFLKSWSAYYNYMKAKTEDPLIKFKEQCKEIMKIENEDERNIKFYNFYFAIILHKKE